MKKSKPVKRGRRRSDRSCFKFLVFLLFLLLLLVAMAVAFQLFNKVKLQFPYGLTAQVGGSEPKSRQVEPQDIVARAGRHIVLPKGETPSIAQITDIGFLMKTQPFYEGAKNGDEVLIYQNAKMGYIYDPVNDIIVKVGPIYMRSDPNNVTPSSTTIQ